MVSFRHLRQRALRRGPLLVILRSKLKGRVVGPALVILIEELGTVPSNPRMGSDLNKGDKGVVEELVQRAANKQTAETSNIIAVAILWAVASFCYIRKSSHRLEWR